MKVPDRMRVLLLGYGEMGHAMEYLLARRHTVRIWQRRPPDGAPPLDLAQTVPDSDVVLFCLPATAHTEVARLIAPFLPRTDTLCVTIAKGLDEAARLPIDCLRAVLGPRPLAVLYGPMISEEIRDGKPAFAECGSEQPEQSDRIASLFAGSALHIETAQDLAGLSWSAILKNVYALAFGMADALELGDNVRGFLSVQALHELAFLVATLGGQTATPYRLAGLGDLITTATSRGSHHHALGQRLARGERSDLAGEGTHTLALLRQHPRVGTGTCPLFHMIDVIVRTPVDVRSRMLALINQFPTGTEA